MLNTRTRFLNYAPHYILVVLAAFFLTVEAQTQEIKAINMTELGGTLELGYDYRKEERNRNSANTSSLEELRLNQKLRLNLDGYIMHPRFLEFRLSPEIEWEQRKTTSIAQGSTDSNNIYGGGELRVGILKESNFPSSVFWSKKRRSIAQLFSRSNTLSQSTWGGDFQLRKGPLPLRIHFRHSDLSGSGSASDIDESSNDLTISSRYRLSDKSTGEISYNLLELEQKGFNRMTTNHRLTLSNVTFIDDDKKKRLDGYVRLLNQSGFIENDSIFFRETFAWEHTDKLRTRYGLSGSSRSTNSDVVDTLKVNFGLGHQLYDSLFTNFDIDTETTDSNLQKSKTSRVSLSETYTKNLGNWGHGTLGARAYAEVFDIKSRTNTAEVIDESIRFDSTGPIALSENNVIQSSIRVTDVNSLRVYQKDIDYTIIFGQTITLIDRLPLGDIPQNATVLVSYRFDLGASSEVLTVGTSLRTRISWKERLSVYAQWNQSDQKSLGDTTPNTEDFLDKVDHYSIGTQLNWRWLLVGVDYISHDSTRTPFESTSEHVSASTSLGERMQGQVSITHQFRRYFDLDQRIDSWSIQSTLHGNIYRRATFELEARYRIQEWSSKLDTNNFDLEGSGLRGGLRWQFHKLTAQVDALWSQLDQESQTEDEVSLEFTLIRRF